MRAAVDAERLDLPVEYVSNTRQYPRMGQTQIKTRGLVLHIAALGRPILLARALHSIDPLQRRAHAGDLVRRQYPLQ